MPKRRMFTLKSRNLIGDLFQAQRPTDGLCRVTFTFDPGWVGLVREDGTGTALQNPSHTQMMNLRREMAPEAYENPEPVTGFELTKETGYGWAV